LEKLHMTDRERWTVYPLLFLALGVSLKDKLSPTVNMKNLNCETMVCKELLVSNSQGVVGLRAAGGNLQANNLICNAMTVTDSKGKQRVSITNGGVQAANMVCGALVIPDAQGKEAAAVSANDHGGFVRTHGKETGTVSFLGNTERIAGLLFIDAKGGVHPGPFFTAPAPAEKPAEDESTAPEATPDASAPQREPAEENPPAAEEPAAEAPAEAPPESNQPESP
jgi:hypothetical protein